jgi:mono/diheme cytochrome c family protein
MDLTAHTGPLGARGGGRAGGRLRHLLGSVALALGVAALVSCVADGSPEIPVRADGTQDPVLVQGAAIFEAQCARCHGAAGGGGLGPRISGDASERKFATLEAQIEMVRDGRKAMPAFGRTLDAAEIEAVVRYTREVL